MTNNEATEAVETWASLVDKATAWDELGKKNSEIASLRERVKELEEKLPRALTAQRRVLCEDHDKDIAELHRVQQIAKEMIEAAEARAETAERERVAEWNLRREAESQRDTEKAVTETFRRKLAKAMEALKPFADAADDLDDSDPDRMEIWEAPCAMQITAGHLRAACAITGKD